MSWLFSYSFCSSCSCCGSCCPKCSSCSSCCSCCSCDSCSHYCACSPCCSYSDSASSAHSETRKIRKISISQAVRKPKSGDRTTTRGTGTLQNIQEIGLMSNRSDDPQSGLTIRIDAAQAVELAVNYATPLQSPNPSSTPSSDSAPSSQRISIQSPTVPPILSPQSNSNSSVTVHSLPKKPTHRSSDISVKLRQKDSENPEIRKSEKEESEDVGVEDGVKEGLAGIKDRVKEIETNPNPEKLRVSSRSPITRSLSEDTSIRPLFSQYKQRKKSFTKVKTLSRLEPILVVEDDSLCAKLLTDILKRLGFINITHARDGSEAVQKCQEYYYKLIFMDINMLPMNGIEASRQIRLEGKNTKTQIVWQSNDIEAIAEVIVTPHSNNKINKTYNIEEIRILINKLLHIDETLAEEDLVTLSSKLGVSISPVKLGSGPPRVVSVPEFGHIAEQTDTKPDISIPIRRFE